MTQRFHHEALLHARLELGLTQEGLAASVGVDVRTYRRYESGEVNEGGFTVRAPARRKLLEKLGEELGLALSDLVVEIASPVATPAALFRPEYVATLQRAPHFVGRDELLDDLLQWATRDDATPGVVALVGVGGSGKTALAERVLARLGSEPRSGGLFVWSFYEDERTEAFLARAGKYFTQREAAPGERLDKLEHALSNGPPHMLVLDGLEVVQARGDHEKAHGELHDSLLRRLLIALARGLGAARALVTSRFVLGDLTPWADTGLRTIQLGPLAPVDAEKLLRSWGARGDALSMAEVISASGGHALSLAVTGSYVGAFLGGDVRPLEPDDLAEAARDDPLARRLSRVLAAYARALAEPERDLMARLSVLSAGADEAALQALSKANIRVAGALAGLSVGDLRRLLARLERFGLVFRAGTEPPKWSSHPFVRDYFRSLLGVAPSAIQAALHAPPQGTLIFSPRQKPHDRDKLDAYEDFLRQLIEVGQALEACRTYLQTLGGFSHLGLVLGEMSRGARILRLFGEMNDPQSPISAIAAPWRASLLYERGLYAGALGDLTAALRAYEEFNRLAETELEPSHLVTGLRTLAYTERLRGDFALAREHVGRSIELAESLGLSAHVARGIALLASIHHDMGKVDAARSGFARLSELGDARIARRGFWEAEHLLALGERDAALEMISTNVATCEKFGWAGHVAHGKVLWGLAIAEKDPAGAQRFLEACRAWVGISGEVEMAVRMHELAAHVALSRGALFEAAREALSGERLAETCGMRAFRSRLFALALRIAHTRGDEEGMARIDEVSNIVIADDHWGIQGVLYWVEVCSKTKVG
ncbi:MAG TPA: helix-turn-helix transcriptional regulator [Polyangium sp.]|nr:helix-turn-helix transcriptional regulator [Polyangium sp.]